MRSVSVYTRRLSGSLAPGQPKLVLNSKKIHELSDREECQEFQLLVVQLLRSQFVDEDEVTIRPVTLNRTSNQFEDQHGSRFLRVLRTLVLVAVVLVGREGWFHILVESLPYIRREIFRILFSLEQNQVVDLMVLEGLRDSL